MSEPTSKRLGLSSRYAARFGVVALVGLGASTLALAPSVADAAATRHASSVCSKVPASKVAAIVGYSVPAGQVDTITLPASKTNYEISTTTTSCTYGSETSLATLPKVVILDVETTSKPLTSAEVQQSLSKLKSDGIKMTIVPFSGLSGTAFYFTESESGINAEGVSVFNGTHGYGASIESNKLSKAKLATLAQLASGL